MSMSFINETTIASTQQQQQLSSSQRLPPTHSSSSVAADDSSLRPVYTIEDLGIPSHPLTQRTILGPTRSIWSLSRYEWLYLGLSIVSVVISMALSIERLVSLQPSDSDFTFAVLLLWTNCFCFVYVTQGIFRERAFELLAFVLTTIIVMIYVIFNYTAKSERPTTKLVSKIFLFHFYYIAFLNTVRLVVTISIGPILIVAGLLFGYRYYKSKSLIFRTIGANALMQWLCEFVFIESSLLKFDAQLAGSSLILWLNNGFTEWDEKQILVISIGSVVTVAWIALGFLSMRFENKILVYIFIASSVFEPIIIIWNLVRYSKGDENMVLELSVYLAGIIAIIVRILTVLIMIFVMINFGSGLKDKIYGTRNRRNDYSQQTESTDYTIND